MRSFRFNVFLFSMTIFFNSFAFEMLFASGESGANNMARDIGQLHDLLQISNKDGWEAVLHAGVSSFCEKYPDKKNLLSFEISATTPRSSCSCCPRIATQEARIKGPEYLELGEASDNLLYCACKFRWEELGGCDRCCCLSWGGLFILPTFIATETISFTGYLLAHMAAGCINATNYTGRRLLNPCSCTTVSKVFADKQKVLNHLKTLEETLLEVHLETHLGTGLDDHLGTGLDAAESLPADPSSASIRHSSPAAVFPALPSWELPTAPPSWATSTAPANSKTF